jgi:hypothetical protein
VPIRCFHYREPEKLPRYGPKVDEFMLPLKTLLDKGVKVVGQTEATSGIGWIWSILMNRKNYQGKVVGPEQALDRVVVLKMWTSWASEYVMKEKDLGSLEVGKLATRRPRQGLPDDSDRRNAEHPPARDRRRWQYPCVAGRLRP